MKTSLLEKIVLILVVWAVLLTFVVPFFYSLIWVYSAWIIIPAAIFITYRVILNIVKIKNSINEQKVKQMKKKGFSRRWFSILAFVLVAAMFSSCERVAPNYYGVKMSNYGKAGKSDYSVEVGRVWTATPGTELWQVPAWEQRTDFGDRTLKLKASDNIEFFAKPIYSYKVIKQNVIDVVFNNARLGSGEDFMCSLEDNILEAKMYDIIKEESRKFTTDELMTTGGSLKFENHTAAPIYTTTPLVKNLK